MNILYLTFPLSALLIFAMALGLGYYLARRFSLGWSLFITGGVVFVLSQVLHIPFNLYVLPALSRSGVLPSPEPPWALPFSGLVLGLSSGIFEETARYLMYRFWARDARTWAKGLMAGAGHGGVEAMIVGALILYGFIQLSTLRGTDLSLIVPPEQLTLAEEQVAAYWSTTWYDSMAGALERAFAIPLHLALSVMVLQVFLRKQVRWLFLAIGWHTLVNAVAAVYIGQTYGTYAALATLGLFTLASIAIIFALRRPEIEPEPQQAPEPLEPFIILPVSESEDQVEDSRYSSSN